ncbi:MAG: glycine zipper domain-containing protein [Chitinophagaceae bacterium]
MINKKNRAAGAVIGGVIGAGGGYVLGRKMDKKDGRY